MTLFFMKNSVELEVFVDEDLDGDLDSWKSTSIMFSHGEVML